VSTNVEVVGVVTDGGVLGLNDKMLERCTGLRVVTFQERPAVSRYFRHGNAGIFVIGRCVRIVLSFSCEHDYRIGRTGSQSDPDAHGIFTAIAQGTRIKREAIPRSRATGDVGTGSTRAAHRSSTCNRA